MSDPMPGWERIRDERLRQIRTEGWTPEHDDEHDQGELVLAALCYAAASLEGYETEPKMLGSWPWEKSWWKPSHDPVRNLEKAGALIAAEIDRLTGEARRG